MSPMTQDPVCSHGNSIGARCRQCSDNHHLRVGIRAATGLLECDHGIDGADSCKRCADDFHLRGWDQTAPRPAHDPVNHPRHYTSHPSGVECIQLTEHMGFNLGNALKYIWRADEQGNAVEDLKKAVWYIQRELGRRERFAKTEGGAK